MSNALHQPQQPLVQYDAITPTVPRWLLLGWFRREQDAIIRCDHCFERPGWIRYDDFRSPISLAGLAGIERGQRLIQIHRNYAQAQYEHGVRSYRSQVYCLTCAASQIDRILPQMAAQELAVETLQGADQAGVAVFMDMQIQSRLLFVSRARTSAKLFKEIEKQGNSYSR